jgi:hypothetical protein
VTGRNQLAPLAQDLAGGPDEELPVTERAAVALGQADDGEAPGLAGRRA